MINLKPEICFKLRDARREAKISQGELAEEVGCNQSAISMFEQGKPTKLNDEVVEKIAKKFGVSLTAEVPAAEVPVARFEGTALAFCPNPNCPGNRRYQVEGRSLLLPDNESVNPVGARFCALCGEVLERKCPNCGATVHKGAICSICGEPYIMI